MRKEEVLFSVVANIDKENDVKNIIDSTIMEGWIF
jgi:hypothetical protein